MRLFNKFEVGYWNVGVIEQPISHIMKGESYSIRWLEHRYKDRFFADPFLLRVDNRYYFFLAEELEFTRYKGVIVLLTVEKATMQLVDRRVVVDDDFHLSYPFVVNQTVLPENHKSGRLHAFGIDREPVEKWVVLDFPLIDPTLLRFNDTWWIFGTTKDDPNRNLSIFYEKDGRFVPHKKNPVKVDSRSSRPGGSFFWYNGELYRPAQNCERRYGENINIMKINRLDEEDFDEEFCFQVSSRGSSRFNLGLHTFNVYDDFVLVDGYERSIQIREKIRIKVADVKRSLQKAGDER